MPKIFREDLPTNIGQTASKASQKAESFRQEVKEFAQKTSWIPIFGNLTQAASRESDAVMALLWGRGESGELLEKDQRLKQSLLNHAKAYGNHIKAMASIGSLIIPEAAAAKFIGSSIKGAKVVQGSARLGKAVKYGEKAAKVGWEVRKAHKMAEDVNHVFAGLNEIRQHGLSQKAFIELGSAGLGRLAEKQEKVSLFHGVMKFGENSLKAIGHLPEKDLNSILANIPDEAIAPDIQKFAKIVPDLQTA